MPAGAIATAPPLPVRLFTTAPHRSPPLTADAATPLAAFGPVTRAWFTAAFAAPTRVQREGWPAIARGDDALLIAPTGSGKTLAAFLWGLDRLTTAPAPDASRGYRLLYVSPLKALVYDVEKNLRAPLAGLALTAARLAHPLRPVRVDVRTGDTPADARRRMARDPGDLLITTPESLYLLLTSDAAAHLAHVEAVIVDEVHALAPTKRGAHLALSLARLDALAPRPPQRIGLSATVRPAAEVARYLTGGRPAALIDAAEPPRLDLEVIVPLEDMARPAQDAHRRPPRRRGPAPAPDPDDAPSGPLLALAPRALTPEERSSVWPAVEPRLLELILAHRSTLVFVQSRGLAERLAANLNDRAGAPLVRAHHGSLAHAQRALIEDQLKRGELRGLVATSSLELGIDMGAIDLVLQVESPDSAARGLQRVGRAGHQVGATSKGRIFPKHRGDLLEATVVARLMLDGRIEALAVPRQPLDVLAQQIVAMCAVAPWPKADLARVVRSAWSYRDLGDDALHAVLDMLSGRWPSTELADLTPRLIWDRATDTLTARRGARMVALINGGTIPDRGLYTVHVGAEGARIGELDEEMVHEARPGDTFILGASTWRIHEITRDRVLVEPAPGQPGKLPFWKGDGPGRPLETGRAIGAFVRELGALPRAAADAHLRERYPLDALARHNLLAYLDEQREATGTLPTDRALTVERFRDELGDWRVCLLTPFGARVHAPWALALEAVLTRRAGFDVQALWSDDGIVLRFADADEPPGWDALALDPDEVEALVVERLASSALFAATFRESAARALLLPRRNVKGRAPLWQQRLRAARLLAVVERYPSFPIVLETYRTCLADVFDLAALRELLGQIAQRTLRVDEVETRSASPFARSLVFAFVAAFLYEGDTPLAERKAQALALDHDLLRELLGQEQLRELLDPAVLAEVERELQRLPPLPPPAGAPALPPTPEDAPDDRRARHPDALADLLRQLGALTDAELAERAAADPAPWLAELAAARRAVRLRLAGAERWIAVEDAPLYRDALGAMLPGGLPEALLAPAERPLEALALRHARTHGPFTAHDLAAALALPAEALTPLLEALTAAGRLLAGGFRPGGSHREYCDPEVLRRLRRRTLARLRHQVEPVDAATLGRFLAGWHGLAAPQRGPARLLEVIAQLEGLPLPWSELEARLLPARVPDYHPRMLDELGAAGLVVWVGRGPLGPKDGRVALYRREHAPLLLGPPPPGEAPPALHLALLDHLARRGASFTTELALAAGRALGAPVGHQELVQALWDLVWAGRVTNDTFGPLRALASPHRAPPARGTGRAHAIALSAATGGRWSPVADLFGDPALSALSDATAAPAATDTARLHAQALGLLERWGVLSREAVVAEELPGGFAALYPVLRALEERGKVRRGRFVEGLAGAQFALPGAVDRLRAARSPADAPEARLLAATDPATPWGALWPWPEASAGAPRPRRVAGASVVLVDGAPALWVGPKARQLVTAPALSDPRVAWAAFGALRELGRASRGRLWTVEQVDGVPARGGPWEPQLLAAGLTPDYRGLLLPS